MMVGAWPDLQFSSSTPYVVLICGSAIPVLRSLSCDEKQCLLLSCCGGSFPRVRRLVGKPAAIIWWPTVAVNANLIFMLAVSISSFIISNSCKKLKLLQTSIMWAFWQGIEDGRFLGMKHGQRMHNAPVQMDHTVFLNIAPYLPTLQPSRHGWTHCGGPGCCDGWNNVAKCEPKQTLICYP